MSRVIEMDVGSWFLLQAKPKQHDKALYNLRSQEYECFSPTISLPKIRDGRKTTIIEPLFPSYIFIKLEWDCNWLSVSSTRGVGKFVRFGLYPTVVPWNVIENIQANLDLFAAGRKKQSAFNSGDTVTVNRGGFSDFEGIYKCAIGNNRSIILIKYLQKVHEITVKTEQLKRAG